MPGVASEAPSLSRRTGSVAVHVRGWRTSVHSRDRYRCRRAPRDARWSRRRRCQRSHGTLLRCHVRAAASRIWLRTADGVLPRPARCAALYRFTRAKGEVVVSRDPNTRALSASNTLARHADWRRTARRPYAWNQERLFDRDGDRGRTSVLRLLLSSARPEYQCWAA
jgi:hypothetical protein